MDIVRSYCVVQLSGKFSFSEILEDSIVTLAFTGEGADEENNLLTGKRKSGEEENIGKLKSLLLFLAAALPGRELFKG